MKAIAPKIKEYEIDDVFHKFDLDNSGKVTFEEFFKKLRYGIEGQHSNFQDEIMNEKV